LLADFKVKVEEAMLAAIDRLGGNSWIAEYLDKPIKLIEILFEIGFIKLYSQQLQQYLAYYETSFLSIENIQRLKIHEVLRIPVIVGGDSGSNVGSDSG
jgi:hypothetical protein